MAQKLTITIPDDLHGRIEPLRERMNMSRVCAEALRKEADMLEVAPVVADPDMEKLIQRLQTSREAWYNCGRLHGKRWAVEQATRDQLRNIATTMADWSGVQLAARKETTVFDALGAGGLFPGRAPEQILEHVPASFAAGISEAIKRVKSESPSAGPYDEGAYLEGWRDVVKDVWAAIAPALGERQSNRF